MSASDNGTEYIFVEPDGTEHYEICFCLADMHSAKSMHNACLAMPVWRWNETTPGLIPEFLTLPIKGETQ